MASLVAQMRENRNAYRLLVSKPEGKEPLGRPRPRMRRVESIKMYILEIELGGVDWTGRARNRENWRTFVHVVMNFRVL
jgi:hypothetical protein